MVVKHADKNSVYFETVKEGVVFSWDDNFFIKIEPVYTDFDIDYETYEQIFNAVNLRDGTLFYFLPQDKVMMYPATILEV